MGPRQLWVHEEGTHPRREQGSPCAWAARGCRAGGAVGSWSGTERRVSYMAVRVTGFPHKCLYSLLQKYLEPVYFYIYTLFGLQAVYVTALYVTSWLLSGTWLSGLLAASWYVTNR